MVQINENNKGRKEKDKLKLAHNKWSDWSKEEKSNKNGGGQRSKKALMESRGLKPELENNQPLLPESGQNLASSDPFEAGISNNIDWRTKGAIEGIQDQGNCGAAWSYASATTLEAGNYIKKGALIKLSE